MIAMGTSRRDVRAELRCEMMCDVMKNNVKHHGIIPENHLSGAFRFMFSFPQPPPAGGLN